MIKLYLVIQCSSSHDSNSSQVLMAFKNKALADHYKHDKECEFHGMKNIYFYISTVELK